MTLPLAARDADVIDAEGLDVRRAVAGDEGAFERLYRRHVGRIHTLARRMADADAADDLTQDIFVRAWDKLGTFRGDSAFGTWLYRLGVNVILSHRRSTRADQLWFGDDTAIARAENPPSRSAHPAARLDLDAAIARLPEGARRIFVLHDVEGWTHEEIGQQLGLVAGTSKSQLSRARAALRSMLDAD